MYYIVFWLPVAAVFAALQVFLCKKSKKKAVRLVPLFISLGITAALGLLLLDPVSGFLAQYIDWGVLALIVYLVLGAGGSITGIAAGWIIHFISEKRKQNEN